MRLPAVLLLLAGSMASAHIVPFQFLVPDGVGARGDGGSFVLQWTAGPDTLGNTEFSLYARRGTFNPLERFPPLDAYVDASGRPIQDGVHRWDATGVSGGCWQPFAMVTDQVEGTTYRPANGVFSVGADASAVWFDSVVASDAGAQLSLRVDLTTARTLTVGYAFVDGGSVTLATTPLDAGRRIHAFIATPLPAQIPVYFWAETNDCRAWSREPFTLQPADAGTSTADAGFTPVPDPAMRRGCGCSAAPGLFWLLLLTAASPIARRRTRSARRSPRL